MKEYDIPNYDWYILVLPCTIISYKQGFRNELSSRIGPNGYVNVTMTNNFGDRHPVELHTLIGEMFVERPCSNEKLEINHKDGNKLNNDPNNLEWVTRGYNQKHAYMLSTNTNKRCILTTNILTGEKTEYYSLRECARVFGVDGKTLHERLNRFKGKPWRGHIVEYKDIV